MNERFENIILQVAKCFPVEVKKLKTFKNLSNCIEFDNYGLKVYIVEKERDLYIYDVNMEYIGIIWDDYYPGFIEKAAMLSADLATYFTNKISVTRKNEKGAKNGKKKV